jgi:hypothetical protein
VAGFVVGLDAMFAAESCLGASSALDCEEVVGAVVGSAEMGESALLLSGEPEV